MEVNRTSNQTGNHDTGNHSRRPYRVQLGYAAVTVQGESIRQAIEEARRRLCLEMPRLWDRIRSATDDQFVISELA